MYFILDHAYVILDPHMVHQRSGPSISRRLAAEAAQQLDVWWSAGGLS